MALPQARIHTKGIAAIPRGELRFLTQFLATPPATAVKCSAVSSDGETIYTIENTADPRVNKYIWNGTAYVYSLSFGTNITDNTFVTGNLFQPWMVQVSPAGNVFVYNSWPGTTYGGTYRFINIFNSSGTPVLSFGVYGAGDAPFGGVDLTHGAFTDILVTSTVCYVTAGYNYIYKFDPLTGEFITRVTLERAGKLATDGQYIYALHSTTTPSTNYISQLNPSSLDIIQTCTYVNDSPSQYGVGFDCATDGHMYLGMATSFRKYEISPVFGTLIHTYGPGDPVGFVGSDNQSISTNAEGLVVLSSYSGGRVSVLSLDDPVPAVEAAIFQAGGGTAPLTPRARLHTRAVETEAAIFQAGG